MGIGSNIGKALLAQAPDMAPGAAVSMLRSILGFAIDGASSTRTPQDSPCPHGYP